MGAKSFREIIAWQLGRELRRVLRPFWLKAAASRDFKLCDQLRNAARSVTANIAEGFPCSHAEYARFLEISSRSLEEIEDRLVEMIDDELIEATDAEPAFRLKHRTSIAIARFRAYLLSTPDPPSYKRSSWRGQARRTERTKRPQRT